MKLAVPDMISNSYFPAEAAIELGFFRDEGLNVSLEMIFPVDKAYMALRDGAVDFVGGSAHSALAAFPQWEGVKLICAQAQGTFEPVSTPKFPANREINREFHQIRSLCE